MHMPFRFAPAIIYVTVLSTLFLSMQLMRPPHSCGPFHIFRHHRTSQPMSCQGKQMADLGNDGDTHLTPAPLKVIR
ncbi:hypothetical protein GGD46_006150 [Rhizobium lusitanum]|uniref:Uncharacterized protein n=1 Tax=Rhizobium lusitanum TaxID=293958 RepID=A0A7X0MFB8_9HYPH|nr:hypothetical protein [Rhizobium lusitanum]